MRRMSGDNRDGASDAEALLLAAREARPWTVEAVLDLVPEVGATQRALGEVVGIRLGDAPVVELDAREHVLLDRHRRERVRALEHHADLAAHEHGVDAGTVEVAAVDEHLTVDVGARDDLVHAVQRAEERRLAATGRADERGDAARLDVERDAFDSLELAVVDVEVADFDSL
jgi:hypothetical protein